MLRCWCAHPVAAESPAIPTCTHSLLPITVLEGAKCPAFLWKFCAIWWGLTHSQDASLMLWIYLKSPLLAVNGSRIHPERCPAVPASPARDAQSRRQQAQGRRHSAWRILNFGSCTGTETTVEQFVAQVSNSSLHTVHLRRKRGFYSEKKTYFLSHHPPRLTLTHTAAGFWLLSIQTKPWARLGALGSELSSTPAAAYSQSKIPSESSPDPHPALPFKHMQWLSGDCHLCAAEASQCHGQLWGFPCPCLTPSSQAVGSIIRNEALPEQNNFPPFFFFNECNNDSTVMIKGSLWLQNNKIRIW